MAICTPPVTAEEATPGAPAFETIVTAPKSARAREDDAASATVVTRDRTPRAAETMTQLVSELPGASVTRYGGVGALATLSLRGSSPNQVAVYVDGVPLNSATAATVDLGLLPLTGVERLELYRGASPISFGSSAIGGVVSISTAAPERSNVAARAGIGSFGLRSGGAELALAGQSLSGVVAVGALSSRGDFPFDHDRSTVDRTDDLRVRRANNALEQLDAATRVELALPGARRLHASASAVRREQGLPGRGQFQADEASLAFERLLASVGYDSRGDLGPGGRLRLSAYGVGSEQRFRDLEGELGGPEADTRDRAATFGGTVVAARWFERLRLVAMADGRTERFRPHDRLSTRPRSGLPATRAFAAGGLEATYWLERLALDITASARLELAHDRVSRALSPADRGGLLAHETYLLPSVRLSLVQRPSDVLALRANVGRYGRLPTMMERYGNNGLVRGAPDLVPERGLNADLGARLVLGDERLGAELDVALFGARADNLIHFRPANYVVYYANVGRARVVGVEAAASLQLLRHGRLVAQTTAIDARDVSGVSSYDGKHLPNQPRLRAYARPELRDLPLGRHLRAGLHLDVDVMRSNHLDGNNLNRPRHRTLFGAGAALAAPSASLRALLTAHNLLDASVSDVFDFPLPGRSIFVSLEWSARPATPKESPR